MAVLRLMDAEKPAIAMPTGGKSMAGRHGGTAAPKVDTATPVVDTATPVVEHSGA
ncbi:hypothetical protein [Bordetella bronchialis]|uniref:hypothetical protein n=1 Tax=Bordetella bronchialis TaxID=463025 RepID=UPI0012E9B5E8|nr:hypothetical protein [Bordetella bronchialis]